MEARPEHATMSAEQKRMLLAELLRRDAEDPGPLSFAQQRLWLLDQLDPGNPVYNVARALHLRGRLDVDALRRALEEIVRRHEALRTNVAVVDGEPAPVIAPPGPIPFVTIDLSHHLAAERLEQAIARFGAEARHRFDLAAGPLVRVTLARLGDGEHALLLLFHHIAIDGWSLEVFHAELAALYGAFTQSEASPLPELPLQYRDVARWERTEAKTPRAREHLTYWQTQLAGAPAVLELPSDRSRPAVSTFAGARHRLTLDGSLGADLAAVGRRADATLFMTLLAAFTALLARYTGRDDIVVGSPVANRLRVEVEPLIGFFVNTLALRADLSGDPTFLELLDRVRTLTLDAYANQDTPFERVIDVLQPQRVANANPLVQVLFAVENASEKECELPDLTVAPLHIDNRTARVDLTVIVSPHRDRLEFCFEYSCGLFERATIERFAIGFETLLRGLVRHPASRISALPILREAERRTLIEWSATPPAPRPERCIHEAYRAQAERTPDAIAVVHDAHTVTYAELDARADRIAHRLIERGVRPGMLAGICTVRSVDMVVGMLAILKAGAAYLPLDPDYPAERLGFMLGDAKVRIVLAHRATLEVLPPFAGEIVRLDDAARAAISALPPVPALAIEHPAYAIYTSGSTGTPKAVLVPHRAVTNLVADTNYVDIRPSDVIAQIASSSFDAATFEVWGALLRGARLVICPKSVALSPGAFADFLQRERITVAFLTTALFNEIVRARPDAFGALETLLFGGEVADPTAVRAVLAAHPPRRLCNVYGPTETTTFATFHRIDSVAECSPSIPIGRPIAGARTYVLDRSQQFVPIGVAGELFVGGAGVALGYLGQPALSAARFAADPFSDEPDARMYRTGDLARYRADGAIEFLGRCDEQVKIRGFRIEPGEVETALRSDGAIADCAVLAREERGQKQLVAYIVPRAGSTLDIAALRGRLAGRLPAYMLPGAWALVAAIPLMPNGKIDRAALGALPALRPVALADDDGLVWLQTVHLQIRHIWESLLGVSPIAAGDDFFELGGHSLLAARMIAEVERVCGQRISLASLLAEPTIARVAQLVLDGAASTSRGLLVKLQPHGTRTPFFYLHGDAKGGGFYCREFARSLGPEQPLYVLNPFGTDGLPMLKTIEEMAAAYVAAIRQAQPVGPYRLGGFCNGGMIAYEIARQLERQGQLVERLILVNAAPANAGYAKLAALIHAGGHALGLGPWVRQRIFVALAGRLRRLAAASRSGPSAAFRYLAGEVWGGCARIRRRLRNGGLSTLEQPPDDPFLAIRTPTLAYIPQPYAGSLTLLWAEGDPRDPNDPTMGWGRLARRVEIKLIPGDHLSSLALHARELSARLRECLRAA